jgi:AcrR family transcriptional regulator
LGPRSRSEATRARILAAAAALVTTTGPESASIEMIAQVAGIARQTVYNYYPRRAQLLIDMARSEGAKVVEQMASRIDLGQAADELVVRSELALIVASQNNPVLRLLLTDDTLSDGGEDAQVHEDAVRHLMELFWSPVLGPLAGRGHLRQDLPRTIAYLSFIHFVLLARCTDEAKQREVVRRWLESYVLPAVLEASPKTARRR